MKLASGYLTYCTNIHAGETWADHFSSLQQHFPKIRAAVAGEQLMGIGLRLSGIAAIELLQPENLKTFKEWLNSQSAYVFTMNGFPFGEFHYAVVKDMVHAPDWTTDERVQYTRALIRILAELLPEGMDGGISTSPLSYRHWHQSAAEQEDVMARSTRNISSVLETLYEVKSADNKIIHIDIEPEPDGLLETGREFIHWYENVLLPMATKHLSATFGLTEADSEKAVKEHICLCYDVCHFAIGYEPHAEILQDLESKGIRVGKIQISAALKADIPLDTGSRNEVLSAFGSFNESVYLHQVVARSAQGQFTRYRDLPEALNVPGAEATEWRAHFHVPVFVENLGLLSSTQSDIVDVLQLQVDKPFTAHMEVETYTWEVLPEELKLPIADSISRELNWVKGVLQRL